MGPREIEARVARAKIEADIGRLENRQRGAVTGADAAKIDAVRARADSVLVLWNETTTPAMPGESVEAFRRRCLAAVQKHSPKWKSKDFARSHFDALDVAEDMTYADATAAAFDSSTVPPGELRAVRERDEAGRLVTRWVGDNSVWMNVFSSPGRRGYIKKDAA